MGEIADMMLEGELCEHCGASLEPFDDDEAADWEPSGIPDYCDVYCAKQSGADWWIEAKNVDLIATDNQVSA